MTKNQKKAFAAIEALTDDERRDLFDNHMEGYCYNCYRKLETTKSYYGIVYYERCYCGPEWDE